MKCHPSKWLPKTERKVGGTNIYSVLDFPGTIAAQRNKKVVQKKVTPKQADYLLTEASASFPDIVSLNSMGVKKMKDRTRKIKLCLCPQDLPPSLSPTAAGHESHAVWPPRPNSWSRLCFSGKGDTLFNFDCQHFFGEKKDMKKIKLELSHWRSFFSKSQSFPLNYYHLSYFQVADEGQ